LRWLRLLQRRLRLWAGVRNNPGVRILVNGNPQEIPEGLSVPGLIEHLKLRADRVAIERNLEVLPRKNWGDTQVAEGDRFEIVTLVGGG
jgi:sulfur carrier protein